MHDLAEFISWAYKAIIGLMTLIIGFFVKGLVSDMKDNAKKQNECDAKLSAHELYCANTYAKETTIQQSLSRLHDRIDEQGSDIKSILQKVGNK